jgi:hypothetical protein
MANSILDALDHPVPPEILRQRSRRFTVDRAATLYMDLCYRLIFSMSEYRNPAYENPSPYEDDRWFWSY